MKITKETILKTLNSLPMPTWIKRIFNMIIEYTSDISNLITNKADLVDGKVPAEQLPSYVDDVIEFNNLQAPDTQISIIVGNNSYKNQIRFINGSSTSSNRIGSEDKYSNMFVNFGENTSEDDWTTFEPEKGKIYINTTNNHSYRWSGSYLIDLDSNWSQSIKDLQKNTIRTDTPQDFSTERENQALSNIGSGLFVVDLIDGKATLTADQEAKLLSSSGVILRGTVNASKEALTKIYFSDYQGGDVVAFYALRSYVSCLRCTYTKATKIFMFIGGVGWSNPTYVSTGSPQNFSMSQQSQAFKNLGWKVHVISESAIGSSDAVSDDEKAARLAATALLVQETGEMYIYGHNSSSTPSDRRFYRFRDTKTLALLTVVTTTGLITQPPFVNIYDENVVSFNIDQSNVSNDRKNKALGNIGLGFVIVDYSELSTTLSDDRLSQLVNAKGIILTNTPDNYIRSVVFTAGTRLVNSITFSSVEDAKNINYIILNIPNKALSLVQTSKLIIGNFNQNLTNTEKDTVLSNIGLNWIHVPYSLLGTTLDDATYTKLTNAYGIILTDVPSNYAGPIEFTRGVLNTNLCIFVTFYTQTSLARISIYPNNKQITKIYYSKTYEGAIPYDASINITLAKQDVALSNIGLNFVHIDYSLLGTTVTDEMLAVLDNAKGIILVNLPSNYYNPFVFIKGNNTSTGCIFVSFATGTKYCQIKLDKSTKILSNINANLTYIGTVRYIEKQSLTDTQKQQARSNIGATSCYDEYKLAGGTKYTTEADFNAQLVKVMDMTVVE